jgi:uncharacterized protein (TIGR04141 family)
MNKKIIHLTVFLIKEEIQNPEDALKDPKILVRYELKSTLPFQGCFYLKNPKINPPWWTEFVQSAISSRLKKLENISTSAIILIKTDSRIFAFTFGYGRHLLKPDSFEMDFGLKVALNAIDPDKLRSIDVKTFQDLIINTSRQANRSSSLDTFGLDISRDVLRAVTGEPRDLTFASRITGVDALAVNFKIEFADLQNKCQRMLSEYRSDRYKERFGWIDHLRVVRDVSLIESLDAEVISALIEKDFGKLSLAMPQIIEWSQIIGFKYAQEEDLYSELFIEDYVKSLEDLSRISIQELKRKGIRVYAHDQEEYIDEWSVYRCLTFEAELNENLYVLTDGTWFKIARTFAEEVRTNLSHLSISSLNLPKAHIGENEGDYNKRATDQRDDIALMDKKLIRCKSVRGPIEACDFFTCENQFVHVKKKTQSHTLSHLFAQGMVSAEEFLRDSGFRENMREILSGCNPSLCTLIPENRPNPEDYEIVYAVIAKKSDNWPLSLPFFSQLHLMQSTSYLHVLGYRVSTILIELD